MDANRNALIFLDKPNSTFFLVAGPCVLQSDTVMLAIAEKVQRICDIYQVPLIFKASFDKANRTSGASGRGPGLDKGLSQLARLREQTGLPILTDIHEPQHAAAVAEVVDVLQIPAFLCRQTDLLLAAGATAKPVNIKKGQFMAPGDMKFARDKVLQGGDSQVTLTERGSSFGYRDLVVDLRSLAIMRSFAPVVFDGTHSVQQPGGGGGFTSGNREMVPVLVRGAIAAGIDGLYLEVHTDPESSPSDAANMITPETLERHLPYWLELHATLGRLQQSLTDE